MNDPDEATSILSHGERAVARRRREGQSPAEIADARDTSVEAVEKAVDRIEQKTRRAVATLLQSPDTETVLAALEEGELASIREQLPDE